MAPTGGRAGGDEELSQCVSHLILEWAEKLLDEKFECLQDLACHLLHKMCFDTFSAPALALASLTGLVRPACPVAVDSGASVGAGTPGDVNKHRETQLQLQRKLHERFVIREQKRKLQGQQQGTGGAKSVSPEKAKSKRARTNARASSRDKEAPVLAGSVVPKLEPESSCSSSSGAICDKDKPIVSAMTAASSHVTSDPGVGDCLPDRNVGTGVSLPAVSSGLPHQCFNNTPSSHDSGNTDNQLPKRCKTAGKLTSVSSNSFLGTLDKSNSADSTSTANSSSTKRRKSSDDCVNIAGLGSSRQNSLNVCTNSLDLSKSYSVYRPPPHEHCHSEASFPRLQDVNTGVVSLPRGGETDVQLHAKSPQPSSANVDYTKFSVVANKLPIPRLSNPNKNKQLANVIIFPPATTATILQHARSPQKFSQKKYKLIQPKPQEDTKTEMLETNGEMVSDKRRDEMVVTNCDNGISVDKNESTNKHSTELNQESCNDVSTKTAHVTQAVKNGTNDERVRCLESDALLSDYFHGGNNSQEQEEELMKYFQHQNSSSSNEEVEEVLRQNLQTPEELPSPANKCDQLSQLRLLLERNLKPVASHSTVVHKYVETNRPKTNCSAPSKAVSLTPSTIDYTGSTEGSNLPVQNVSNEFAMTASKSLSLLSRRSQQHSRNGSRPNLTLPSLASSGHSLATRRRVSFETSVLEHAVPQSPNTRSFTPISPGPYSPVSAHRNFKSSSVSASPFMSPRNTPVLRSKLNFVQGSGPQPSSYVVAASGSRCRQSVPAKIVRSNSVNSHSICMPHRLGQQQTSTFAIPDSFPTELMGAKHNLTASVKARPAMSPLSISAPQSPMLHYQHSAVGSCKNESNVLATYGESLLKEAAKGGEGIPGAQVAPSYTMDPLAQEVTQIFQDASSDQKNIEALLAALPSSSQMSYRSQSVPLHRMMCGSTLVSPQSTQPSPLFPGHQPAFTFSCVSSAASSVAPTPVPSEFMDFTGLGDADAENEENDGINSESLAQILNILTSSAEQRVGERASFATCAEDDVENENLALHNQQRTVYSSRSYPNTPVPYKSSGNRDPLVSCFNLNLEDNFGTMSRSYPSTPLLGCPLTIGEELGPLQGTAESLASSLLSTQHEQEGLSTGSARRSIGLMSTLCVDELQLDSLEDFQSCDPLSQLVREVEDASEQVDAD